KQRSFSAHSLRTDSRLPLSSSSLLSPAQPIQSPPPFRTRGFMALARPPELGSVFQPPSVFRNVSGRRFETTMSRASLGCTRDNLGTGCMPTSLSPWLHFQSNPVHARNQGVDFRHAVAGQSPPTSFFDAKSILVVPSVGNSMVSMCSVEP